MSDWLEEAKRKREAAQKVWDTIPSADHFNRGQCIAALTALGATSGNFSGEPLEGGAFFARQPTGDLRSLLRDHWYLRVRGGEENDYQAPDVSDVPEPEFKPEGCRCNCGYSCGRSCGLPLDGADGCIALHFKEDCDHDFSGEWESYTDVDKDGNEYESGGSVTCKHCGTSAMGHAMLVGP